MLHCNKACWKRAERGFTVDVSRAQTDLKGMCRRRRTLGLCIGLDCGNRVLATVEVLEWCASLVGFLIENMSLSRMTRISSL